MTNHTMNLSPDAVADLAEALSSITFENVSVDLDDLKPDHVTVDHLVDFYTEGLWECMNDDHEEITNDHYDLFELIVRVAIINLTTAHPELLS